MDIGRREFLHKAGLLGGAALAASALPGCHWFDDWPGGGPLGSMIQLPASSAPVDHVVVVMMENRSFDHYLGWLADDADYVSAGLSRWGSNFRVDGNQHQSYLGPDQLPHETAHLFSQAGQTNPWRGCGFGDPGHGWTHGRVQRDQGFLAPGSRNDEFALGYYLGDDLPITAQFAKRFTTFDHYHASLLGPTWPNREYLHSGQSGGNKSNTLPNGTFTWATIWDKLVAAGVPCQYYYSDLPVTFLWGTRLQPISSPIAAYYDGCSNGTLPNVTMVDPTFLGEMRNDDHPLADIRGGQRFIRDLFKAFVDSPHWERGAFIVTYDEWGGFFDHVAPPHLVDGRTSAVDDDDFSQAGFRVPTVLASPFARPNFVDHRVYDHTSVLRFLQWRFLGALPEGGFAGSGSPWALTWRDRNAYNIGASLAREMVDADVGFDLDVTLDPISPPCDGEPGAAGFRAQPNPAAGDDAFDEIEWSEFLGRNHLKVDTFG